VTAPAKSRVRKLGDLLWVLREARDARLVFLHHEYDRAWPLMRRLAAAYRRHVLRRTCVVAVAGSVGKTTTKRALDAVLGAPDRRHSRSNYRSSLAENLLRTRPGDLYSVIEIGLDGRGQMADYTRMLAPDVAVVTAITSDHYPAFPTLEHTRAEKALVLADLPPRALAVLNGDDPHVRWMATRTRAPVRTYGLGPGLDIRATDVRLDWPRGTQFTLHAGGASAPVRLQLLGRYAVYPALAAAAVGLWRGLELPEIEARLGTLAPAPCRMEIVPLPGEVWLVDDSYKGTLQTVHAALDVFADVPARRRIVVLGPMMRAPGNQQHTCRELGARVAALAQRLILLDDGATQGDVRCGAVEAGMDPAAASLTGPRIDAVVRLLREDLRPGDVVLLKGGGRFRLNRVALALAGREVRCTVRCCQAKVRSCGVCPFVHRDLTGCENHFIRRYVLEL